MSEKRSFYGKGEAKGFKRLDLFNLMLAALKGEEIEEKQLELMVKALEYEIEGAEIQAEARKEKQAGKEKKNPLESDYAKALIRDIVPFVGTEPKSCQELADAAKAAGKVAPSGKPYMVAWIAQILRATPGIVEVTKVIEKVKNKDGVALKSQSTVKAFKRG